MIMTMGMKIAAIETYDVETSERADFMSPAARASVSLFLSPEAMPMSRI